MPRETTPNSDTASLSQYRTMLEQRLERAQTNENLIERMGQLEALYEELDAVEEELALEHGEN